MPKGPSAHLTDREKPRAAPRSSPLRRGVRKLHLFVGLLTGPIVLIVGLTGCLWAFQAEIESLFGEKMEVKPEDEALIGPLEARRAAKEVFPDRHTLGLLYGSSDEPVELIFHEENPEFYRSVFLDPYSGELLGTKDHTADFFHFILDGHMYLWLPEPIGGTIVSWGVLLFFINLLSGLFLWWPRNQKERGKRFRLNFLYWRNLTQKRFDLHAVVGSYAFIFATIFATTGLTMSFTWFSEFLHKGMGGEGSTDFRVPEAVSQDPAGTENEEAPIEQLPRLLTNKHPEAESFEIHYPHDKERAIYVELSKDEGIFYNNDYRFYDPRSLEPIPSKTIYGPYKKAPLPDKLMRMDYDIHVGSILGLPGKIIAFLSSLTIASLPVTGTLLWWNRRKKGRKGRQRKARSILQRSKKKRDPTPSA